jgi:hypothetical protein
MLLLPRFKDLVDILIIAFLIYQSLLNRISGGVRSMGLDIPLFLYFLADYSSLPSYFSC